MDSVYIVVCETEREKYTLKAFKSNIDARRFCIKTFLDDTNNDTPADVRGGYKTLDNEEISFSVGDSYLTLYSIIMKLE